MAVNEEREAILQDMEVHKREIQIAVEELAEAAKDVWPSPRERIRARPVPWVLGALALGIVLGLRHRD